MTDKDMVSKAEVLDIYAELYDEFDDAPDVIKVLHKVYDKINRLQSLEPGGWISVKDRKPEANGIYLTWCTFHDRKSGFYRISEYNTKKDGWYDWIFLDYDDSCVKYWMPLSEPPKEEEHKPDRTSEI